jgi:hypothetical protein
MTETPPLTARVQGLPPDTGGAYTVGVVRMVWSPLVVTVEFVPPDTLSLMFDVVVVGWAGLLNVMF